MSHCLASRATATVAIVALSALGLGALAAPASADTSPAAGTPATVGATALPTWQIDGVAWQQTMIGNTVFVTGDFSTARPPGVAVGGAGSIQAKNFFAYDITTGNPVSKYSHYFNAPGYAVQASPDGKRLYVAGDFTTVDSKSRGHIAVLDVATGALLNDFQPSFDSRVRALAVSGDTVYAGGTFTSVDGTARNTLAAVTSTGSLLPWAPSTATGAVLSMVVAPDNSRVVVGGQFATLNGANAYGHGAVDPLTGASVSWPLNAIVRSYNKGGITSLRTDGTYIYGTSFAFGTGGTFEGSFVANPDGTVHELADCLGDTYDTAAAAGVLYSVGHAHNCAAIGGFPDTNPRVRWFRAVAMTIDPVGLNKGPDAYGWNFSTQPAPKLLHFFPDLAKGTYTGQNQAAWTAASNGSYLALGGEFVAVNGAAQQGLTRFAVAAVNPTTRAPRLTSVPTRTVLATRAVALAGNTIKIFQQSAWDEDNENLTYEVWRDQGAANQKLVTTQTLASNAWTLPDLTFTDTAVPAGSHTYRIRISDGTGNSIWATRSDPVTTNDTSSPYVSSVRTGGASSLWRLDEASGTAVYDLIGDQDGTAAAGVTRGTAGAIIGDTDTASTFSGASTGFVATGTRAAVAAPSTYSVSAWFKTTSTTGGRIVGFSDSATGSSSSADRMLYVDSNRKLRFGAVSGGVPLTVASQSTVNDGAWHQVVASYGSNGMTLYLDGEQVARDNRAATPISYNGYWRIGGDAIGTAWNSRPSSGYLAGSIDDVAVYPGELSEAAVRDNYAASGRTAPVRTAPTDTLGAAVAASAPDNYWRFSDASGQLARSASSSADGIYAASGVSYGVAGVTTANTAARLNGSAGFVTAESTNVPTSEYSAELWFKTTSTQGGQLFGEGDAQTGLSSTVARAVTLTSGGQLRFVSDGQSLQTTGSYNNGAWHQVVATRTDNQLRLYVDGVQVGAQAAPEVLPPNPSFWRVGFDRVATGATSNYLAADVDEFSTYSRTLSAAEVKAHYQAGGGTVANQKPTGTVTAEPAGLQVSFSVNAEDPDGSIAGITWNLGDGRSGTGPTVSHTYAAGGTYQVSATITDNEGASTVATASVTVTNAAPTPAFEDTEKEGTVTVDGSGSIDPDGSIAGYSWNFGDGSAAVTGATASHTYASSGSYPVTLTVTDNAGASASLTRQISVSLNKLPTPAFTATVAGDVVSVDGSGSSDPDGTIASYAWDFGDASTGTGATASHTYAAAGTYQVKLTVTDNAGATAELSQPVTVTAVLARDSFNRTVAAGWGSAEVGGAWTATASTGAAYAVSAGAGQLSASAGAQAVTRLATPAASTDVTLAYTPTKAAAGGSQYFSVIPKGSLSNGYAARVVTATNQSRTISLTRIVGGTETVLVSKALATQAAGTSYQIRVQADGTSPTTLRMKVWATGTAEPAAWDLSTTDATASLVSASGVSLRVYAGGTTSNGPISYQIRSFTARLP